MIKIATGTAHVLGLKKTKIDNKALPTTAHFMTTGQCVYDCSFCSQAKSSKKNRQYLSRVTWPIFNKKEIEEKLQKNLNTQFKRICLQIVQSTDYLKQTLDFIDYIKKISNLPLSVSIRTKNFKEIKMLFNKNVNRIGLAIDTINQNDYKRIKKGNFKEALDFISLVAKNFPNRITTHLIIGFSETEKETIELMKKLNDLKITISLFAFTPIAGTELETIKPPTIQKYRHIQLAHFLITHQMEKQFKFNKKDELISFGYSKKELLTKLQPTSVFETTGCPFCNRPYYNEKPGTLLYNYPYKLSKKEFKQAINNLGKIC
ncbi:MAG: radical SAM protein [Patescibacteria group bacterium]|nr:radical SAM protein [Patescibacteria group bacterium]